MNTVYLKRNPDGKYNVIELGEFDTVCANCLRLLLEDHNDIYDQGQLVVDRINTVIHLVNQMVEALKPPDYMNKTYHDNPLMSLITSLLGPLKEDANAQAAEESHTENL